MSRVFRRRDKYGKWIQTYYCWVPDPETGGTRRVSTKCTDKRAAEQRAAQLERDALDPDAPAQAQATLRDAIGLLILDRTSQAKGGKRSMATVSFYEKKGGILLGVMPTLRGGQPGDEFPLRAVDGPLVDDYIVSRRDDGAKESTIHKELTTWRASMRLAKRRRLWKGDLEETFPKFSPDYKPKERFVQAHEVLPLRDGFIRPRKFRGGHEGDPHGHALWGIAAFIIATSAEWGAVWRARPEDIDQSDPLRWYVHVRGTKREARDRDVPIVHLPFALLLDEALRHADGDNGLFLNRESSFRHRLGEACERAGIPHLSPNDLRRTHGKWLRLAGATTSTIYPSLGHHDGRMTERVYAKASPRELADVQRAELAAGISGLLMGGDAVETGRIGANRSDHDTEKTQ